MKKGIIIEAISVYHPATAISNEHYINYFLQQNKDITHLLRDVYGKQNRYVIDNQNKSIEHCENSLTMQIQVAKNILKQENLTGQDIHGIIVATQFPEYTVPPNSMFIHNAIHAHHDCFAYDINVNCLGMVMALQQAYDYMMRDASINRILIIGGDYLTLCIPNNDENLYGLCGDSACAIILKRTEEHSLLLDSLHFINSEQADLLKFPFSGLSNVIEKNSTDLYMRQSGKITCYIPLLIEKIRLFLTRNNLTVDDIGGFCFSQYAFVNNKKIIESLHIPVEKCPYVGDKYGYTGGNSPFMALNELVQHNRIKRGDYILFWTIGATVQHILLLIRY